MNIRQAIAEATRHLRPQQEIMVAPAEIDDMQAAMAGAGESSPAPDGSALVHTLTMCLHWAEKDAALYEATLAPEGVKAAMRHRVKVIRDALAQNKEV